MIMGPEKRAEFNAHTIELVFWREQIAYSQQKGRYGLQRHKQARVKTPITKAEAVRLGVSPNIARIQIGGRFADEQ